MASRSFHRTACDHCDCVVEVDNLTAYYAGSQLPVGWFRLTGIFGDGSYRDLCPACLGEFRALVEEWTRAPGHDPGDHPTGT